MLTVNLKTRRR